MQAFTEENHEMQGSPLGSDRAKLVRNNADIMIELAAQEMQMMLSGDEQKRITAMLAVGGSMSGNRSMGPNESVSSRAVPSNAE